MTALHSGPAMACLWIGKCLTSTACVALGSKNSLMYGIILCEALGTIGITTYVCGYRQPQLS